MVSEGDQILRAAINFRQQNSNLTKCIPQLLRGQTPIKTIPYAALTLRWRAE